MPYILSLKKLTRSTPVEALRVLVSQATDRLYGLRTEQSVLLEEFGLADPNRLLYVPSSWKSFRVLKKVLRPTANDTFVDFGSGKGRVVMLMALGLKLRRVVGVEISPELTAIAQENLERVRPKLKTASVDLVVSDATEFTIPDDMTIAYIYSSFTGPIFQAVIEAIRANLPRFTGQRLIIALQRPTNGTPRDRVLATNDEYLRSQTWLTPLKPVGTRSLTGWRTEISLYSAFCHTKASA